MNDVLKKIRQTGIIPVIKIDDVEKAVPLAKALCDGGLPCAEITFRTAQAEEAIRRISEALPDMLLGAGTILTTEQVDRAVNAGASFIVSPGLNPKIVKYWVDQGNAITTGCANPSDVEQAIELGLDTVKFFPAEQAGGINMIKAMAAPYVNMKFMPTGGISPANLNDYLSFPKIIACGGSWMVKDDLIQSGNFEAITKLTKEAVQAMLGFEFAHIGINSDNEEEATKAANLFGTLFGMNVNAGNTSIFTSTAIEVMKSNYLGAKGHIAIKTNYMDRAIDYLKGLGVDVKIDTAKYKGEKMTAVYLDMEIAGFAIHLLQK